MSHLKPGNYTQFSLEFLSLFIALTLAMQSLWLENLNVKMWGSCFLSSIYFCFCFFFEKGCLTVACTGLEFILYPCFVFELLFFLPLPLITGQWHWAQIFPKNFRYEAVNLLEILFLLTVCGAGGWIQALFLSLLCPRSTWTSGSLCDSEWVAEFTAQPLSPQAS